MNVIGALQHPSSTALLVLQVLQKALVESVSGKVSDGVDPGLIRRYAVAHFIAQALEHLRGDLGAFLRRIGGEGMKRSHLRRQMLNKAQLAVDLRAPPVCALARVGKN